MRTYRRPATGFALVAALLLIIAPLLGTPVAAQTGGPMLRSVPTSLDLTVPLGTTASAALQLANDGTDPLVPQLYEAFQPAAQLAAETDVAAPQSPAPQPTSNGPVIDPQIAQLQAVDPQGQAAFLVFLDSRADLAAAYRLTDWAERGRYVDTTLRNYAEASQRELRATLRSRGLPYTPLWIVNALAVRGNQADVAVIAAQAHVAELRVAKVATIEPLPVANPAQTNAVCDSGATILCWNIAKVGAGRVWNEFGVTGAGITVANIDTGVRFDHPALLGQYRGNTPTGLDHQYNWYDPYDDQPAPVDAGNHGSHTMGTMVARGSSATQPAVGMAPGARWIAVRGCGASSCDELTMLLAAQWLLAPTDLAGLNPRPELRPHVINNSWITGPHDTWFAGPVAAWRAAGIYPVFAAGNTGNATGCGSIQSPGDYAEVTAVGATDSSDRLTNFSSIGPTLDGRVKPDLSAPGQNIYSTIADAAQYGSISGTSMATPHVAGAVALLWSANPALIGDYAATYAALIGAATPITNETRFLDLLHTNCQPTLTPNNIYGYGRLDVYKAVAAVKVDVPWLVLPNAPLGAIAPAATNAVSLTLDAHHVPGPGVYQARVLVHGPDLGRAPTIVAVTMRVPPDPSYVIVSGQVRRAADGLPLAATVRVVGGGSVLSDAQGHYSLTLPPRAEPYQLAAVSRGYQEALTTTTSLEAGARLSLDFSLETDQPRVSAELTPRLLELSMGQLVPLQLSIGNSGSQPLSYTLSVPVEPYGVWRSDEADSPPATWTDPPPTATALALGDDGISAPLPLGFNFPFAYTNTNEFAVAANGMIILKPTATSTMSFTKVCLPMTETPGPAIAPLRVDLDPSQPGARVSYARTPEGMLISWEQVPLFKAPATAQPLSFQALLMPDGRISLRYKRVGAIAPNQSPSLGLQFSVTELQSLGCISHLPLADGLTIELRPQVPGSFWLSLGALTMTGSVAPGNTVSVPVTANWISPLALSMPRSGVVELRSNDPSTPLLRLTVRMRANPAPHTLWLALVAR